MRAKEKAAKAAEAAEPPHEPPHKPPHEEVQPGLLFNKVRGGPSHGVRGPGLHPGWLCGLWPAAAHLQSGVPAHGGACEHPRERHCKAVIHLGRNPYL